MKRYVWVESFFLAPGFVYHHSVEGQKNIIRNEWRALTAEQEVAGSISRTERVLRVLKYLRNEGIVFARPAKGLTFAWLGWPRKMAVTSPVGDVKIVSSVSTFGLNTLTFWAIMTFQEFIFLVTYFCSRESTNWSTSLRSIFNFLKTIQNCVLTPFHWNPL